MFRSAESFVRADQGSKEKCDQVRGIDLKNVGLEMATGVGGYDSDEQIGHDQATRDHHAPVRRIVKRQTETSVVARGRSYVGDVQQLSRGV